MRFVPALRWLFLTFLLAAPCAWALDPARPVNEYTLTAWTMEDGLPHNLIQRIAQDADGFLWIGTWEGAARFNGQRFTVFDARSAAGPEILGVRGLLAESDRSILFGTTQSGVRRLAEGRWSPIGGEAAAHLKVTTLLRDRSGALWIGTENSLFRLDADGRLHAIGHDLGLDGNLILSLLQLRNGDLLIGNNRGLHRLHDGRIESLADSLKLPKDNVRSLLARRDGSIVVGGDGGVWQGDATLSTVTHLLDQRAESMIEDRHRALWISTSTAGLVRYHADRSETIDQRLGLDGRGSAALFEDREGLIWIGTTNGLYRLSDGPVFGIDKARGLADGYVRAVLQVDDGSMWMGHAVGVDRWQDGRVQPVDLTSLGSRAPSVMALARGDGGSVLLGTYDQGVLRVDGGGSAATRVQRLLDRGNGLPSNHVRTLWQARDGALWIGTTAGLSRYHDSKLQTYTTADGLPADFIRVVHEAADGRLWIGTSAGIALRDASGTFKAWLPGKDFPAVGSFDFLDDPDGTLWIASDRGLLRLRDGRFRVYDHSVGLPRDSVFRILDDGDGSLWLSSNGGVVGIRRSELDAIDAGRRDRLDGDVIDYADGMPSSQANGGSTPAGWRSRDGRLWFPTAMGVAVVDPDRDAGQLRAPVPMAFEEVSIDGNSTELATDYPLAADVRRIAIQYAGLNFRANRDLRYRYRMTGFDERWLEAGTGTEAVFTNLPPGKFRFEVQAMTLPVDWQRSGELSTASIGFEIQPPFWRSIWFIALATLAILGALAGLFRWRLGHYRRRQRQLRRVIRLRTHELSDKHAALERAHAEREQLVRQLAHQAHHDALTELPNRRAGDEHLLAAIRAAHNGGGSLTIGLLDIDQFKHINDRHGHDGGDAVLKSIAATLGEQLGSDGFAARHGGEEFLITLKGLTPDQTLQRLDHLRRHIAATAVSGFGDQGIQVTVSIGSARWVAGHDARSLLVLADKRLYRAKREGRNRIVSDDTAGE